MLSSSFIGHRIFSLALQTIPNNGITPDTPLDSLRALYEEAYSYGKTKSKFIRAKGA